jgi:hypothetical protein
MKISGVIIKIISGVQTGVDRGALEAALDLDFPYGGYVPKGRRSEDGIVPLEFAAMTDDTRKDYLHRTELNVINSDATLILSRTRELTGGTKRTAEFGESEIVLNIAGPRESKEAGIQAATKAFVARLIA